MQSSFHKALEHVLRFEGGYSNHPLDPGGATNMGITHKTLAAYRNQPVTRQDVRNLTMAEVKKIYRKLYWQPCQCDRMPEGIDLALFDCAVNQGVSRAAKAIQQAAGIPADGQIGPATLAAIARMPAIDLLSEFIARRMVHYGGLQSLFRTFGLGWSRRLSAVHTRSLQLILDTENRHELHS